MNDPENFLARWSRRKREVDAHEVDSREVAAREPDATTPETSEASAPAELEAEMAALASPEPAAPAPAPVFDLASLPSLDSIGADTDIRGFLAPGVPTELAQAALRRVWTADPGIRDFKGLAENDWDFTAPGSMFGFGELAPGTDVKQMLADVFGDVPSQASAAIEQASAAIEDILPETPDSMQATQISTIIEPGQTTPEHAIEHVWSEPVQAEQQQSHDDLLHRDLNTAMQNNISTNDDEQLPTRRQHGGALPQ